MIHTILLNSRDMYSGNTSDGRFLIDWALLPDKKFKVTWGFGGGSIDMSTGLNDICLLYVELGQDNIYISDTKNVRGTRSRCIGVVVPNETLTASTFLYGDKNINGPVFLDSRPTNNEFSVSLKNLAGQRWVDSVGGILPEYILNLSFEEM